MTPVVSPALRLVEQLADGEAPARDDIFGSQRVIHAEDVHRLLRPVDRHNLPPGVDDEHDERSVLQPLRDLLINLGIEVVGRDDLDGEIRRSATVIPTWYPSLLDPFTANERDIGRTDR